MVNRPKNGAPAPYAPIEVEWRNDGSVQAPADAFATQTLKADAAGVFSYAMPRAGWWGFAALVAGNAPLENPEGRKVPVEAGGLIWVRTRDMKSSANQSLRKPSDGVEATVGGKNPAAGLTVTNSQRVAAAPKRELSQ